jgi:hypothetical protein
MNDKVFFERLKELKWNINLREEKINNWENLASGRLLTAPDELKDFISSYSLCANTEDNIWFLSCSDYMHNPDISFPWNEFENQSKEYADKDMLKEINAFWEKHIPFLFSVKNGYSFLVYCIKGENCGKIFYGYEPEYEDVSLISYSLEEFKDKYINALEGRIQSNNYKAII